MKQCYKCKETKPVSEFPKSKKNKDGLFSYCKKCKAKLNATNQTTPKGRAYKLLSDARYNKKGKRAHLEKTLMLQDILPTLEIGKCELTGLPFDFTPSKNSFRNLYSPSLDRIDSNKGYTKNNVRIVLSSVNCALGEYTDEEMLPILEAMVKGIKNNVKQKSATQLSKGTNRKSKNNPQHGTIPTAGIGEDSDDTHHHSRTIHGQDTDHSAKEGSGDGMGCRGTKMATLVALARIESNGEPDAETVRLEYKGRYILD